MILERRHQPFNLPDQLDPQYPISDQALTQAFERAKNRYQGEVQTMQKSFQHQRKSIALSVMIFLL